MSQSQSVAAATATHGQAAGDRCTEPHVSPHLLHLLRTDRERSDGAPPPSKVAAADAAPIGGRWPRLGCATPRGLGAGLGAPSLLLPSAARGLCSLAGRPAASLASSGVVASPMQRLGLGLGPSTLWCPTQPGVGARRAYLSDGELLGAAYLTSTDIMFWSGLIGAVVFRRNLIVMLLCTEIVMLACNMNFLFAAAYLNDMTGVIMSITITTIAACETAIGLALCVTYFHIRSATDVEALNLLNTAAGPLVLGMVFAGLRGLEAAVPTLWRMPLLNARKEPIWRLWPPARSVAVERAGELATMDLWDALASFAEGGGMPRGWAGVVGPTHPFVGVVDGGLTLNKTS
ncbi:hypothetical protein FOA52_000959 [Chlamydomonas sp. UWO 241]|nr:hypothetical protein FOA52_000959 [Chlamydomonas sp. UWO 241]